MSPGSAGATRGASPRWAYLAIVLIWATLFAPQLFARKGFLLGDAADLLVYPDFSAQRWHEHHERTHWTPYLLAGFPTTASIQDCRPQWLPAALLDAYDAVRRQPIWPPLAFSLLAHLAGMLATAALVRGLWAAGPIAMSWGGIAWGLMPNLLAPFAFGHEPQLMSMSFLPLVMLATHHLFADARPHRGALGLALALALQLLAQYPQIVLFSAPLAVAFAIERAWTSRRFDRLAWAAGAALMGAAMSSASWWPAMLYTRLSIRGAAGGLGTAEIAEFSLAPRDLMATVWPWAMGFAGDAYWGALRGTDFPQYLGAPSVALALIGLGPWVTKRQPGATFLAIVGIAGMVLALGTNLGPLHAFLAAHVPLWSSFRVPVNALIFTQLAVALLSARSLQGIMDRSRDAAMPAPAKAKTPEKGSARARPAPVAKRPARLGRALLVPGTIMMLAAIAIGVGPMRGSYIAAREAKARSTSAHSSEAVANRAAIDLAMRALLTLAVPGGLLLVARLPLAASAPLLGAVLLLDLGSVNVGTLRRSTGDLDILRRSEPPMVARLAAADPLHRAMALRQGQFFSNEWIRWRARSISGNHPAVNLAWAQLRSTGLLGRPQMIRALAIGYVSGEVRGTDDTTLFERIAESPAGDPVWRVRGARARAVAVSRVLQVADERTVLAALASPQFDPLRETITADASIAGNYPGSQGCRLTWVTDDPDRLAIDIEASAPAFMVVVDTYFPGWTASVDGRPVTIHRVDHLLRGVALPPGRHRVAMRYEPEGWRSSVRITRAAWSLWITLTLAAAALAQRRQRKSVA